jgi:peptidyl-tRNA hydrolase ICT1
MAFLSLIFRRSFTVSFRLFSNISPSSIKDDPREPFRSSVPVNKLFISFARSGGPGGQNVNKLNTKVELRFHVESADWLPDWVKQKLAHQEKNRINKQGELVVTSSVYRTQHQNLSDAVRRLQVMVDEAGSMPNRPSPATVAKIKHLLEHMSLKRISLKQYSIFI